MTLPTLAARPQKQVRCLVIQLARLGDTLQSLMALRAAKELYPNLSIHFLARDRFAAAAKRVPWIDEVHTLPTDELLGPILIGKIPESQGLGELARWVSPLIEQPWDLLLNWSFSEASSYLTALLPARTKLGYSRRKDLSFFCVDGWSRYIQAILQGGVPQNIHLTDILTTQLLTALQIHFGEPVSDGNVPVTSKNFFSLELGERDVNWSRNDHSAKWIGFQLGAGRESKTWDPAHWAELGRKITQSHPDCKIVLLGGQEDQDRAQRFLEFFGNDASRVRQVLSLVGETEFDLWASVVGRCQWLFAGDTAAIHLASVLGTRTINISVGPVKWAETGPYGNGHYVLSAAFSCPACLEEELNGEHSCQNGISPEIAYATWTYASSEWAHRRQNPIETHFRKSGIAEQSGRVRVFRSKIRNTQDGGGVYYEPMDRKFLSVKDWNSMVMGHIARAWYCGWVPPVGQELSRDAVSMELIQFMRGLEESVKALSKICDEASRISNQLNQQGSRLKSNKIMKIGDREDLVNLGTQLMELDSLVERLGKTHAPLQAFSLMSKVMMHNLNGNQLADLGEESSDCYRQLGEGAAILRDWVKYTLNLAKPVAIKSETFAQVESIRKHSDGELNP